MSAVPRRTEVGDPGGGTGTAVLDIGATKSVIGIRAAKRLFNAAGIEYRTIKSCRSFRFGNVVFPSLGRVHIAIDLPDGVLSEYVDVVDADVPFLLGLHTMDAHRIQALTVENVLERVDEDFKRKWAIPTVRRGGHVVLDFILSSPESVNYTDAELRRLHQHLQHPSAGKLLSLLKRADPNGINLPPETREQLQKIADACDPCQRVGRKPLSFKISFPPDAEFNREVRVDLLYLKTGPGRAEPVLHVVDSGTRYNAAMFVSGAGKKADAAAVWDCFIRCWSRLYLGDPHRIVADQGSVFASEEFISAAATHDVELSFTPVESHNSMGAGEKYHDDLRRVFEKVTDSHPSMSKETRLTLACYAINTTLGPDGIVPCLLLYGALPRLPGVAATAAANNRARYRAMATARAEYEQIVARRRIAEGINHRPSPSANEIFETGDNVYVFREKAKRWTGPYPIDRVEGKYVWVTVDSQGSKQFHVAQCKRSVVPLVPKDLQTPVKQPEAQPEVPAPTDGKAPVELSETVPQVEVHWTETLDSRDPRAKTPEMEEAIRREIISLIERGTFRIVVMEDTSEKNVLPSRFVLAIKHADGTTRYKARFVLGGHKDKMKNFMLHSASSLSQTSVRMLLALSAILGFEVWSTDVDQAYLQSASQLQRDIFIKPDWLELGPNEFLQLLLPLYGLSESGDYWYETLTRYTVDECRFQQSSVDLAMFFRRIGKKLMAMSGHYVDDVLSCAPPERRVEVEGMLSRRFQTKPAKDLPCEFLGMLLSRTRESFRASMPGYIKRLTILEKECSFESFSSVRAKLMWVANCRPDISALVSIIGSVTARTFKREHVHLMNEKIRYLHDTSTIGLSFPKLDAKTLRLVCYVDGSFANRDDKSSQIGIVICLADGEGRMSILYYRSCKATRVCRSAMASECLAFAEGWDNAFTLKRQLSDIMGVSLPVFMCTDSRALFDVLTACKRTKEGRLMIDIYGVRESLRKRELDNVFLIRSGHNLADALTKLNGNSALFSSMTSQRLNHPVENCLLRSQGGTWH